jgi:RimJ/RimL family protein N-acetyltransferase
MFTASDQFDPMQMQEFMRRPEVYWALNDAMAPPPEAMDFAEHLMNPTVWTVAALWDQHIIGYVQLCQRTSIGAEMTVAFHPQARGRVARTFTEYAIGRAFTERGLLKLWAIIPSDNRRAIMAAYIMHFKLEGRLLRGIMREGGPRDLLILGLDRSSGYMQ